MLVFEGDKCAGEFLFGCHADNPVCWYSDLGIAHWLRDILFTWLNGSGHGAARIGSANPFQSRANSFRSSASERRVGVVREDQERTSSNSPTAPQSYLAAPLCSFAASVIASPSFSALKRPGSYYGKSKRKQALYQVRGVGMKAHGEALAEIERSYDVRPTTRGMSILIFAPVGRWCAR